MIGSRPHSFSFWEDMMNAMPCQLVGAVLAATDSLCSYGKLAMSLNENTVIKTIKNKQSVKEEKEFDMVDKPRLPHSLTH